MPAQRSHRGTHPASVGWWRPPKTRKHGTTADDLARHRALDTADLPVTAPTRVVVRRAHAAGRRRRSPQRPGDQRARRRRLLRIALLGSGATVLLSPVLAFLIGYVLFAVPNPDDAVDNQVALVSFGDGSQLAKLVSEEGNRTKVPVEAIPPHVREAVLAAEDRSFYSNPGFDPIGILRAAWSQLRGGVGGGSTITQQYVKKTLVGDEQTLWRKYKEVVLAVKISQERTKDEILGDYLNAIYFGRGAYGIQSASQAYFAKNVEDLTPSEGALLAGLIQSPSRWDPAVDPDKAVQRWSFVLDGMVAQGWLDRPARQAAKFPRTVARKAAAGGVPADSRGHIVNAVTAELEELGITEQDIAKEGLRITTTIDAHRQQEAVAAAHDALRGQPGNLRGSVVAIDPDTGGVLAYYGGDNGLGLDYARARRLAGSTFKPFVVLAGLQQEPPVGLGEVFDGSAVPGLRNAAGADCDRCDLKQAMTISNNVVFNTLAKRIGPAAVADAAHAAGVTAPLDNPTEGIALGNKEVSAFELASAYATIAAGGVWRQPHFVSTVVTADNRVLYSAATEGERRFPERVARNVTEAMLDVAGRDGLALPGGRPVAAKTGTVQSRFPGENNDAWIAGFTPSVATSVWIGTDMNSPIRTSSGAPIDGKSLPGNVWQEFMAEAHDNVPVRQFAPFRPIGAAPGTYDVAATAAPPTPAAEPPANAVPPHPSGTDRAADDADDARRSPSQPTPAPDPNCSREHPCG